MEFVRQYLSLPQCGLSRRYCWQV